MSTRRGGLNMREVTIEARRIQLVRGDITELGRHIGAIVNAAGEDLRAAGGVSGAIHRAGGMEIGVECRWIGNAATGTAVATTAGLLDANAVIHAVGPVWTGGRANEERLLSSAYRTALELAERLNLTSIAFPAISTGLYGFPMERSANVAIGTVAAYLRRSNVVQEVVLVLFTVEDYLVYERCLDRFERVQASRAAYEAAQKAG